MGEHLRKRVAAVGVPVAGEKLRVTISVGVCALGPDDTGQALCKCADQALYRAKNNGRNIVSA